MQRLIVATALALATFSVGGCSYIDRLTGTTDNSVLPGAREDAIPGKTQFPDASDTATVEQPGSTTTQTTTGTGETATAPEPACKTGDPGCTQSVDGTFSDPQ
ncbi:MAG: hypothetical protein H7X89_06785 [Rhizobiales bacterium]|nr:hypothetical protein [Hyphomicrobiales bacterium]